MSQKIIIVVGVVVLGILALFMLVDYKNKLNGQTVSQNILYLTQPVISFSGTVEKIDNNFVTISQTIYPTPSVIYNPPYPPKFTPPPIPTPIKLSYRVGIDQNTAINRPPVNIPYLFITLTPAPASKLTIRDIIIGRSITVSTNTDLRLVTDNQFTATTVSLPALVTTITGKITNIQGNLLTLKAVVPSAGPMMALPAASPVPAKEVDYQVKVTNSTEISHMVYNTSIAPGGPPTSPKPEKLALSDLKIGASINVYTNEDVILTQNLTALRIEPQTQP